MKRLSIKIFACICVLIFLSFLFWMFSPHTFISSHNAGRLIAINKTSELDAKNLGALLPSIRDERESFSISYSQWAMQSEFLSSWGILADTGDGPAVVERVAEEISITEEQRLRLNHLLKGMLTDIRKLQVAHLTVVSQNDNELHLKIRPFSTDGAQLRENLRNGVMDILGPEIGAGIWSLMETQVEIFYRKFGEKEIDIIGRSNPDGYNEIIEDGVTTGFPFAFSIDSMQKHLFKFEISE